MFRGSTHLSLDAKGRMAIPTRYRDRLLLNGSGVLVVTLAYFGHCLLLYTLEEWEQIERKLTRLSDLDEDSYRLKLTLLAHAHDCEPDGSGRILLPSGLRAAVNIDRQVQLAGLGNKFEVWQQEAWEERLRSHRDAVANGSHKIPKELTELSF